jgi:hypothetical protein
MKTSLLCDAMAILIVTSLWVGSLQAQDAEALPAPAPEPDGTVVPAETGYAAPSYGGLGYAAVAPPYIEPPWVPVEPPPKHHWNGPVCRCVRKLCCWSDINCYCCGSLKQEGDFIVGSCRTFYKEPCLPGPPPLLVPPGYEASYPGFYPGRAGCGCR